MVWPTYVVIDFVGIAKLMAPNWPMKSRRMGQYLQSANWLTAKHWRETYLPRHFTSQQVKYVMQKRKVPYSEIKKQLAKYGATTVGGKKIVEKVQRNGVINLVRSGTSERMARRHSPIAAYRTRAVVHVSVKEAVARRPRADRPDMRSEVTNTPPDEREAMKEVLDRSFRELLHADKSILSKRV